VTDTRPNLLLVTVDCLRYDRCGFNGHHRATTPTLDAIAKESTIFDNAYATGTYTTESIPGILAGMHSHNGIYYGDDPAWKAIPPNQPTVASHLRDAGYHTTAMLTNPHLSVERNFDAGFAEFENLRLVGETDRAADSKSNGARSLRAAFADSIRSRNVPLAESAPMVALGRYYQYFSGWPSPRGSTIVDALTNRISADDAPFFAWTHLMDVHRPVHPTAADHDDALNKYSLREQFVADSHASTNQFDNRVGVIYDNAVRYVDNQIGIIVDHLRREGVWENTCLVVTADHGEALFDRHLYGHPRHYLYDELLQVPLLVHDCSSEFRRLSQPFSLAWLGELIADMVGIDRPEFPLSSGYETHLDDTANDEPIVSDALDSHGHSIAVRDGKYKYVTRSLTADADMSAVETPAETGYHVASDCGERNPLDDETVPNSLVEHAKSIVTGPSAIPRLEGGFTREAKRRLEQLGYKM